MFGSSNNNNAKTNSALPKVAVDNFEAYIGKSTQITGNITAQGSIRIDGTFSGIVFSESDVVVGETGNIKANIFGANVTVAGKLKEHCCQGHAGNTCQQRYYRRRAL